MKRSEISKLLKSERIGETSISSDGYPCTLIQYNDCCDVTIRYEDGLCKNISYYRFKHSAFRKMPYTNNDRIQKSKKKFLKLFSEPDASIELIGEYINSTTPVKVQCKTCGHEWDAYPQNLINGHRCIRCKNNNQALSAEYYHKKIRKINPDIEILSPFTGRMERIKVRYRSCGHEESKLAFLFLNAKNPKICNRCHNNRPKVKDDEGNEFSSISEMCKAHGLSRAAFYRKKAAGITGHELYNNMKEEGYGRRNI